MGHLCGLCRTHVSHFVRDIFRSQTSSPRRPAQRPHRLHRRPGGEAVAQARAAHHFHRRFADCCRHYRRRHGRAVANAGPLVVRAADRWSHGRSDLWQAARLLSVHPACMATDRRLAADAQRDRLPACRGISGCRGRLARADRRPSQPLGTALARTLHRGCIPVAHSRHARVSLPLRATI